MGRANSSAAERLFKPQAATTSNEGFHIEKPIIWNRLRLQTEEEVLLADAFEAQGVAFSPQVPIRVDESGHRKTRVKDFLVFSEGKALIVEIDGGSHNGKYADDLASDRYIRRCSGLRVERYTAEAVRNDPHGVAREIVELAKGRP